MTAPPNYIALPEPANLHHHFLKLKRVAELAATPANTVSYWCGIAAASGFHLIEKPAHRRLLTPHGAYVIAVLAAISRAGVAVSAGVIQCVLQATHDGRQPRVPHLFERVVLADGPASVTVDLSTIWLELEPAFQDNK